MYQVPIINITSGNVTTYWQFINQNNLNLQQIMLLRILLTSYITPCLVVCSFKRLTINDPGVLSFISLLPSFAILSSRNTNADFSWSQQYLDPFEGVFWHPVISESIIETKCIMVLSRRIAAI